MRLCSKIARIRIQSRFMDAFKRVLSDECVSYMHSNEFQFMDAPHNCIQTRFNSWMRLTNAFKRVSIHGCVSQMHSNAFQSMDVSHKCIQTRFNPWIHLTNAFKRVSIHECFQTLAKYRRFSDVLYARIRVF